MTFLTSEYGLAPQANLTLVETESGAVNGYSAPGHYLSCSRLDHASRSTRASCESALSPMVGHAGFANQSQSSLARERAGPLLRNPLSGTSPARRCRDGNQDTYVEALTVKDPPVLQAARLEDYSPEYWALTAAKGAAILNMLRSVVGDANFKKGLHAFIDKYSWQVGQQRGFPQGDGAGLRPGTSLLLHSMARIERLAGIQARIHRVPHPEGIPRRRQDQPGSRYLPHACRSADRNRRKSGRQE